MHQVIRATRRDCLNPVTWIVLVMTLTGNYKVLYCKQTSCVSDIAINHYLFLAIYFQ